MRTLLIFLLLLLSSCGKTLVNTSEIVRLEKNLQSAELELDRLRNAPLDTIVKEVIIKLDPDTVLKTVTQVASVGTGLSWSNVQEFTIETSYGTVGIRVDNYYSNGTFSQFVTLNPLTTFWVAQETTIDGSKEVSSALDKAKIKVLEAENNILRENQDSMFEKIIKLLIILAVVVGLLTAGYKFLDRRKG